MWFLFRQEGGGNGYAGEHQSCLPLRLSLNVHVCESLEGGNLHLNKFPKKKGAPVYFRWEYKVAQAKWKTVCMFLKKLKIELLHDPAVSFLGTHPREMRSRS